MHVSFQPGSKRANKCVGATRDIKGGPANLQQGKVFLDQAKALVVQLDKKNILLNLNYQE